MICNYILSKNGSAFHFKRSEQIIDIDLNELIDGMHMIIDYLTIDDIPFIEELAKKCKAEDYLNLAIMDDSLDQNCADALSSIAASYPPTGYSCKIVVSIGSAINNQFSDSIFVGTYVSDSGIVFAQPINAGQLTYSTFKSVCPIAKAILNEIPTEIRSNRIDSIIWIDNWFQSNIQYIKQRRTYTKDHVYICDDLDDTYTAEMPDVFKKHFGVCEDIASSIAILLHMLGIPCKEVQASGHAWLLVDINGDNYIWDCTHNITRNENRLPNALKALTYSDEFTLIGEHSFPLKYTTLNIPGYSVSPNAYPRSELEKSKEKLIRHGLSFSYDPFPVLKSHIDCQ